MTCDFLFIEVSINPEARAPGGSILKYLTSRMSAFFDENLLEVALAMTAQGFVKHVLTEGDKVTRTSFVNGLDSI